MDKDSELRGWKAHCVYLQDKCDRLELENSRLKAFIDEANAQEPISNVDVYYDSNDSGDRILTWETFGSNFKSLGVGKHRLYASPIPAQQQQCNSGTNEYGLDIGYMAGKLNLFLRDISRHKPSEAARVLARLALVADDSIFSEPEFAQQPAYYVHIPAGNPDGPHQFLKPAEWARHFTRCIYAPLYRAPLLQSPRITEQDAREIAQSAVEYYSDHGWKDGDKFWMQTKCLSLLNKLNEAKNG